MEKKFKFYADLFQKMEPPLINCLKKTYTILLKENIEIISSFDINESSTYYKAMIDLDGTCQAEANQTFQIKANLALIWELHDYLKMASAFMGSDKLILSEEIKDVGREIINTIVGNAKKDFSEQQLSIVMASPTSVVGIKPLAKKGNKLSKAVGFKTSYGNVLMVLNHFEKN